MSTSAYRLRHPKLRLASESESTDRSANPLAFLLRRRTRRRRTLVSGWRNEAILRTLTKLG
jgi:hypothetical protein